MEKEPFYNEPNNEGNHPKYSIPEVRVGEGKNLDTENMAEKEEEKIVNSEKDNSTKEEVSTNAESLSNVTKHIDISDLLEGVEGAELLKPNEKDKEYMRAYKRIQLGIDPNEPAFVITPRQLFAIEEILPEFTEKVSKELGLNGKDGEWEVGPMVSILAKALLEESTKYATWMSREIVRGSSERNKLSVCELCAGAGVTSSKIYIETKKNGFKNVQIHAVDKSVESLSIAYLVFITQGIPCVLLEDSKKLSEIPSNFDGVVLIYSDAQTYMEGLDLNIKYDDLVSENGISYFPRKIHDKVLKDAKNHLNPNSGIYISSLDPNLTIDLSKVFLMKEVFIGGNKAEEYRLHSEKTGEEYGITKDGRVTKFLSVEAGREIDLMNYLLKHDLPEFLRYMRAVSKATAVAKNLKNEILSPVEEITSSLSEIYGVPAEAIQKYPKVEKSPCNAIGVKV